MSKKEIEIPIGKYKKAIGKALKDIFGNGYAILSIILAIILAIVIFNGSGISNSSSNVPAAVAGQRLIDFAETQGATARVISAIDGGQFYEIRLSIESENFTMYVTKDGKNLIPSLVPLTGNSIANNNANKELLTNNIINQ
ncbi:MAG: hypothetical protein IH845_00955 [Nanoarchaeota archaeon]|nr:hypothetical protein [Nanoarchaeota archaeon]